MSGLALAERLVGRRYAGLGMRRIWYGTLVILCVEFVFDFVTTVQNLGAYPDAAPISTAWVVLVVADLAVVFVSRVLGEHLPNWLFWLFVAALAVVLALDVEATWRIPDMGAAL